MRAVLAGLLALTLPIGTASAAPDKPAAGGEATADKGAEAAADKGTEAAADKGAEAAADNGAEATPKVMLLLEGDPSIESLGEEIVNGGKELGYDIQPSGLALEDLQVAIGCADRSVGCLQKIGKSVKASRLLMVETRKAADRVEALMRLFDVESGSDAGRATVLLPLDPEVREPLLGRTLARLFKIPRQKASAALKESGTLSITASVPYVQVFIDDQPRGALPLDLRNLPVGEYRLRASRPGYEDWSGSAKVNDGKTTNVDIQMIATGMPADSTSFIDALRMPTWIIGGVGLVSITVASIFGAHMASEQNSFDEVQGNTLADVQHMQDLQDSGKRDAAVANVMFAVGGAALVATAILAYVDYKSSRTSAERPTAAGGSRAKITVGPGAFRVDF